MQHRLKRKILPFFYKAVCGFLGISLLFVVVFRFVPVPFTPLMILRSIEQLSSGEKVELRHNWVPIEKISRNLILAVVSSEDQKFAEHNGFDFAAIQHSVNASVQGGKRLRGASTISQQTAKNVFLWPGRSWIRKGLEVYFTVLVEIVWSKKRIMEVYLNSIEMGRGVYGAEAAAHIYFKTDAAKLTKRQAAAIASILPNPRKYNPAAPSPYSVNRITWIMEQMGRQKIQWLQ